MVVEFCFSGKKTIKKNDFKNLEKRDILEYKKKIENREDHMLTNHMKSHQKPNNTTIQSILESTELLEEYSYFIY